MYQNIGYLIAILSSGETSFLLWLCLFSMLKNIWVAINEDFGIWGKDWWEGGNGKLNSLGQGKQESHGRDKQKSHPLGNRDSHS